MRHVLLSILIAAVATDRLIAAHPVTYARGDADATTPGALVVDATGAKLAREALGANVIAPVALSGIVVAGAYVAIHLVLAASRALAEHTRSARVVERAVLSRGPREAAISRIRDALVRPGPQSADADAFMPASELVYLAAACALATIASGGVALWLARGRSDRRGSSGIDRTRARIASASAWAAVAAALCVYRTL